MTEHAKAAERLVAPHGCGRLRKLHEFRFEVPRTRVKPCEVDARRHAPPAVVAPVPLDAVRTRGQPTGVQRPHQPAAQVVDAGRHASGLASENAIVEPVMNGLGVAVIRTLSTDFNGQFQYDMREILRVVRPGGVLILIGLLHGERGLLPADRP
jgi:hypothetical protein